MVALHHAAHGVSFAVVAVRELPAHAQEVALAVGATSSIFVALLLGSLYGSLVALAPDHLGTVMTLSAGSTDVEAFRVGGAWGLGHSVGMGLVFMAFFVVEKVFGLSSEGWEDYSDYAVGLSMVLCALYFIIREDQYIKENADGTQTLVACECCAPVQFVQKPEVCVFVGTPPALNYSTFGQGAQRFNPRINNGFGQGVQSFNPRLNSQGAQIFTPKVSGGLGRSFTAVPKSQPGKGLNSSRATNSRLADVDLEGTNVPPPPFPEDWSDAPGPQEGGSSAGEDRKKPPARLVAAASSAAEGGKMGTPTVCLPVNTKDSGKLRKKQDQSKQGGDKALGSDAPAALTCPDRGGGLELFGWSHRDVNGAVVGTVQGFCCPMCLVGASFASVLNTPARCAAFVVAFVVTSMLVTGLLAMVWSRIARSGSHWVSSKTIYRGTCTFTLCLGVVWIIANSIGEMDMLEWTKHLQNVLGVGP